jgi:hypothetical protein
MRYRHRLGSILLLVGSIGLAGCSTTETLTRAVKPTEKRSAIKEFAVVAECDVARVEGKDVPGLVVQVILIDETGKPTDADGELSFALYSENVTPSSKMEPDDRFRFADDQLQAASAVSSLGTVHNFWVPRRGKLAEASRIQLVSVYRTKDGVSLAQSNFIPSKRPEIKIEEKVDPAITPEATEESTPTRPEKSGQAGSTSGTSK